MVVVSLFYTTISPPLLPNECNETGKNTYFHYSVGVKPNTLVRNYEPQKQEESFHIDLGLNLHQRHLSFSEEQQHQGEETGSEETQRKAPGRTSPGHLVDLLGRTWITQNLPNKMPKIFGPRCSGLKCNEDEVKEDDVRSLHGAQDVCCDKD